MHALHLKQQEAYCDRTNNTNNQIIMQDCASISHGTQMKLKASYAPETGDSQILLQYLLSWHDGSSSESAGFRVMNCA
jgi:hypothetical protein